MYFIRADDQIMFCTDGGDSKQLTPCKYPSDRIVRIAEHKKPGFRGDGFFQFLKIKYPFPIAVLQRHCDNISLEMKRRR